MTLEGPWGAVHSPGIEHQVTSLLHHLRHCFHTTDHTVFSL